MLRRRAWPLNNGRVMMLTLSILVEREAKIKAFQLEPFINVHLDCGMLTVTGERLQNSEEAEQIAAQCNGKEARIILLEKVGGTQLVALIGYIPNDVIYLPEFQCISTVVDHRKRENTHKVFLTVYGTTMKAEASTHFNFSRAHLL
ncbi:MAG: hypothetical protein VB099_15555 [Candidatus Limiplasma sp.]|nr:hypothetical protein [Candidatus Limiplasma sp.]